MRTRGAIKPPPLPKTSEMRLENLLIGQWSDGVVVRLVDHGAWIDIGSQINGFLHVKDLKDGFVRHPTDELSPGQLVKVCVKFLDANAKVLGLSCLGTTKAIEGARRELDSLAADEQVWGEVTKVTRFGAFVDFGAQTDGFLHVSDYPERQVTVTSCLRRFDTALSNP